jgi:glycosyltransferase involved in cell wall biosynthesis
MRVLQISADRSKRGILQKDSAAFLRQAAYAKNFGALDIIALSLASDHFEELKEDTLSIIPTNSSTKWLYGLNAWELARRLPRPDVVTAQDPFETGLVASRIAKRFGVPLHLQIHTDFLSPAYAEESTINRIRVRIAQRLLRKASGVRVVSDRIARSLARSGIALQRAPVVLPIFADPERLRFFKPSNDLRARFERFHKRILVVSRLEREKNVSLAIESFARLNKESACLIIVGEGRELGVLRSLTERLGVKNQVFFELGVEAAPYFSLADLILVTSLYEGYGLVIVEALGLGKPVISTDVGIAREVGAVIAEPATYPATLQHWFEKGPFEGHLGGGPYPTFDEYVKQYCDDIKTCLPAGRDAQ